MPCAREVLQHAFQKEDGRADTGMPQALDGWPGGMAGSRKDSVAGCVAVPAAVATLRPSPTDLSMAMKRVYGCWERDGTNNGF